MRHGDFAQGLAAFVLRKVAFHLHHHEVSPLDPEHLLQDAFQGAVVHLWQPSAHFGRVCRSGIAFRFPKPTSGSPLAKHAAAELRVVRILFQEAIHPMKGALVGQAHREDDVVLTVGRSFLLDDLDVFSCGFRKHPTSERHCRVGLGAEVHVERHVLECHCGEQGLPPEDLRQRLRVGSAHAVLEERDRVRVGTPLVQVQNHSDNVVALHLLRDQRPLPTKDHVTLRVEAHAVLVVTEDGHAGSPTKPHSQHVLRQHVLRRSCPRIARHDDLHDLKFEHVAAASHADVGPRACEKVLQDAFAERHHQAADRRLNDVCRRT
mmetsp:Transcript_122899/g.347404  ORF Transcript_122899/g.347404 Transcript_122899/m.347404 type:complete len:320 (+) Transcript_122899:2083-3042(+)